MFYFLRSIAEGGQPFTRNLGDIQSWVRPIGESREVSNLFSNNCTDEMKEVVRNELNIQKESLAEKYLGLPTNVGRQIIDSFQFIPTTVKGLIGGWCGREASCAGREILLKTVAQAVPTYSMSCFLLPVNTCNKMRTAIANYWWGSSADNRPAHKLAKLG